MEGLRGFFSCYASPCDAVMLDLVRALPHDHYLAEDPRQQALRLHLPEVHTHRPGPGEGGREGGAAAGDPPTRPPSPGPGLWV